MIQLDGLSVTPHIKMKIVVVVSLCAILAGVASAYPSTDSSAVVQLVNKLLSQTAEIQDHQQQDAEKQRVMSKLLNMAVLQSAEADKSEEQQDVQEQRRRRKCRCRKRPCPCRKRGRRNTKV